VENFCLANRLLTGHSPRVRVHRFCSE